MFLRFGSVGLPEFLPGETLILQVWIPITEHFVLNGETVFYGAGQEHSK